MTPLETIPSQDCQTSNVYPRSGEESVEQPSRNCPSESKLIQRSILREPVESNVASRSDKFMSNHSSNIISIDSVVRLERMNSIRRLSSLFSSSSFNASKSSMNESPCGHSEIISRTELISDSYIYGNDSPDDQANYSIVDNLDHNNCNIDVSSIIDDQFDEVNQAADEIDVDWKHNIWNAFSDDYELSGYGRRSFPFQILGTSATDEASHPHCLSPPLMESLSNFLPYTLMDQNFWMRYSLVRDGASVLTLLQNVRASKHTVIALETTCGDVFGCFTSTQW